MCSLHRGVSTDLLLQGDPRRSYVALHSGLGSYRIPRLDGLGYRFVLLDGYGKRPCASGRIYEETDLAVKSFRHFE